MAVTLSQEKESESANIVDHSKPKKVKTYTEKQVNEMYAGFYHPSSDVHNMCHRGTKRERREELDIGPIYTNAAICKLCGWFIRSKNRHDFVTCKCGSVSVDGGSWYAKRMFKNRPEQDYTDVIEYFNDEKDK